MFVCSANSARSQLAAATWNRLSAVPATPAGTHPAARVHPRAIAVAARHGLDLDPRSPGSNRGPARPDGDLVVAVCDNAHEELDPNLPRLHWSMPDPAPPSTPTPRSRTAFADLNSRVHHLAAACTADHRKAS